MALPTVDQIRSLGLPNLSGDDDLIASMIAAADASLAQSCCWPRNTDGKTTFESSTYTEYYMGPDSDDPRRVSLGLRPVSALTTVAQDQDGDWTYSDSVSTSTECQVDQWSGTLWAIPGSAHAWVTGLRAIKVTCTAGFDVSDEPPLVQAIALLVSHWCRLGTTGPQMISGQLGGSSMTLRADTTPPSVRELVSPYRLVERETHWRHR